MTELDQKITAVLAGLVVRKDLVKLVKGNAVVPGYVLEYLLGQYCATNDEETILAGIENVKDILRLHYVNRNEAELVKSRIKEKGHHKVIDRVGVELDEASGTYRAFFANLGIKNVPIDSKTVLANQKLLVSGIWCLVDVQYEKALDQAGLGKDVKKKLSPWSILSLKPIQMANFDKEGYLANCARLTADEWMDVLIQSLGFDPEKFGRRNKFFQLMRLIPYCERNYNLIELGPKGTGKSHIYSECSPHGMLLSGGEVTLAKLFVNNSTGKIGLVGYWDTIAFDEFAGKQKKPDKALVDVMKNYMANKSFSRGIETLGAEASIAFVGNTMHSVAQMLKNSNLFEQLPDAYLDSAFIDRIHNYIPGWEVDIIRGEMFTTGYGFIIDYLSEAMHELREMDFTTVYREYFTLSPSISTRDRDGIQKTFSGLMKILHPSGSATKDEMKELLVLAMEGRKRVKDQLLRIDATYDAVEFWFEDKATGEKISVQTLEEIDSGQCSVASGQCSVVSDTGHSSLSTHHSPLTTNHSLTVVENQRGIDYEVLFSRYLKGAKVIEIVDPYIRKFHQARNLMDLMGVILKGKALEDEVEVRLRTTQDALDSGTQDSYFKQIADAYALEGISFTWTYEEALHDRWIDTDTGWHIILGRGLDIFQPFDGRNAFDLQNVVPSRRPCKAFSVTYVKRSRL